MEILEAFDLAGSLRGAAELAGCDHKTVAHWVAAREAAGGGLPVGVRPRPRVDGFAVKIEEWVDRSRGRIRADRAHERLVAMGYMGSERTTRRAVARAKRVWRQEHGRRTRPWVTEPGLWMQWDYGDGPDVAGRASSRGESHPPALSEPGVSLSTHRAPIIQPSGDAPACQWAKRPGSRAATLARNIHACLRCRRSRLYFCVAHRTR